MTFLKDWVRNLVMLVLLAGSMELLIPVNGMKKYVRMTMGLVIVLAIVGPVAELLGRPVVLDTTALGPPSDGRLPSVGEVMARGQEFRRRSQALAVDSLRERLTAEAGAAARLVAGVAAAQASVTVVPGSGEPRISGVIVVITPGSGSGAVRAVQPVRVGKTAAPQPQPRPPDEGEAALAAAVRQEVAARLGVNADPRLVQVLIAKEADDHER